jgi:hypothetical protein
MYVGAICSRGSVCYLVCPISCAHKMQRSVIGEGGLEVLEVLGLLSALPSNGPGAILSIRFVTLSPPSIRGLSGAKSGLGAA